MQRIPLLMLLSALLSLLAAADALHLRNGQQLDGRYLGGDESQVRFQYGADIRSYPLSEVVSVQFGARQMTTQLSQGGQMSQQPMRKAAPLIPAGTQLVVRLTSPIDARHMSVGTPFQAVLAEPLISQGQVISDAGMPVNGRLMPHPTIGKHRELRLTGVQIGPKLYGIEAAQPRLRHAPQPTLHTSYQGKKPVQTMSAKAAFATVSGPAVQVPSGSIVVFTLSQSLTL